MKKNYICLLLLGILGLVSCNSWLEVEPKTEIKSDKMFETENGFKEALVGCYMLMADSALYGREMTVCSFEVMAQQYSMDQTNEYEGLADYNYEAANYTSKFDAMWQKMYRIIANLNALIEVIDEKKDILHPTTYGIIKGEAIGLRAFLHFDLLRIFGWGNLVNTPANLDKLCIPYVTEYSKVLTKQSTVRGVLEYIHEDLAVSDTLLNHYDSYGQAAKGDDYEMDTDDAFFSNRNNRFNYRALKATEARVYMWEGKYSEALDAIEELFVEDEVVAWIDPDRYINVEEQDRDLVYSTEHIFNLDVPQLHNTLRPNIESYDIHGEFTLEGNDQYFYTTKTKGEELYEIASGVGLSDYRYTRGLDKTEANSWTFLKFYEPENSTSPGRNKMPLIRKSEMFYYVAECYNNLNNSPKAVEILNEVRVARGILYERNLPSTLSKDEVAQEIQKEWQKEFVMEGQMFFYYKRLGLAIPNAPLAPGDELFIVPLPEQEVEIGGREDYKED